MQEVARPVVFGVVIVLLVFLPLATLEDVEGKMFRPVVYSLCFMLAGALFYALVVVPAIADPVFGRRRRAEGAVALARRRRGSTGRSSGARSRARDVTVAACFAATAVLFARRASRLGAEFLPRIFEGSFCDRRRAPAERRR